MSRIFGISDLPVTIFTTPLEPISIPEHAEMDISKTLGETTDRFISSQKAQRNLGSKVRQIFNRLTRK